MIAKSTRMVVTIIKLIQNIINKHYFAETEHETSDMVHIWGIKSNHDVSPAFSSTLYSLNDFDITYLKKREKYIMSVETIYHFCDEETKHKYLQAILEKFTQWMMNNNYDISVKVGMYDIFSYGINIKTEFDSIEQAYSTFKILVCGYCSDS